MNSKLFYSQMTCYTFYFSLIRCDTLWYILTHPSKLGMILTPYCTFHNLLKNSFQESNWKPIQKSVQKSIWNSVWNFIPKSIQKMDIVNLKCKMAEKIWQNAKIRKDHVWIIDSWTVNHFHNRVQYGVCVYPNHPTHWHAWLAGL